MNTLEAKKIVLGAIVLQAKRKAEPLSPNDVALLNSSLKEAEAIEDEMLAGVGEENHDYEFEEVYAKFLNQALAEANPSERSVILKAVKKISDSDQFLGLVSRYVDPAFSSRRSSLSVTISIAIFLLALYILLTTFARLYGS